MPRYVVLQHNTPADPDRPVHWDLMLEAGAVLWTWALPEIPRPDFEAVAERLADHRIVYLEYEGPISRGRGEVRRIMSGEFEFESATDDRIHLRITSGELPRHVELVRQATSQRWKVRFDNGK